MSMSKNTKRSFLRYDLLPPDLRIVQYNYYCGIEHWDNVCRKLPFWLLFWNEQPGVKIHIQGKTIEIHPGIDVLIPPETKFSTSCGPLRFNQFYINFFAGPPLDMVRKKVFLLPSSVRNFMRTDFQKWHENQPLFSVQLYALVFAALRQIPFEDYVGGQKALSDTRIQKTADFMETAFGGGLRNNHELAKRVDMSVNNFMRVFKRETGTTVRKYYLKKRLERAKTLLKIMDNSIEEVAFHTGFANRYSFSKAFKSYTGSSPAVWRRQPESPSAV